MLNLQYNIKKKEEVQEIQQEEPNPLMRKKKTPEELAAEAEMEDEDELTSEFYNIYIFTFQISISLKYLTKTDRGLLAAIKLYIHIQYIPPDSRIHI